MGRLTGRSIILYDKVRAGVDDFNHPIYEEMPVTVENVLIGLPTPQEVVDTLNLTLATDLHLSGTALTCIGREGDVAITRARSRRNGQPLRSA